MLPSGQIETAAGACGVQNSPPGAWETALFNRVEGCTLPELHDALYRRKTLLQAWSYRDVLLPDKALQKLVWRTVGNPGAVVLDGRISGVWTARTVRDRLELSVTAWQAFSARQQSMLEIRAQEYAAFRGLSLLKYTLEDG